MKVLITGAGGVGMLTAQQLLEAGHDVVLIDIADRAHVPDGAAFLTCDVTDFAAVSAIVEREAVTDVVHTAAMLSTAIRRDPRKGYLVNVGGTANILEVARAAGLRRTVIASSTTVEYSAFAAHPPVPITEDVLTHALSQRPQSIYVATKVANEQLALLYNDLYGLDVVVPRYAAVVSAAAVQRPTSVPDRLLSTLIRAGRSAVPTVLDDEVLTWSGQEEFVDMRDCAAANLAALTAANPTQRVYNIATGHSYSMDEVIGIVRELLPGLSVTVPVTATWGFAGFPAQRPAVSDVSAAARELDFTARYDLAATVQACLAAWDAPGPHHA